MLNVLTQLSHLVAQGVSSVFCRVAETRGSTPQKAGAAMLVLPDGRQQGTLGGGCVEADVKQKALAALAESSGHAQVLTFLLDDNYGWDDGLICGGRMTMLLSPVHPSSPEQTYYRHYQELLLRGQGCTEAIAFEAQDAAPAGSRFLFDGEGQLVFHLSTSAIGSAITSDVSSHLKPLTARPAPYVNQGISYLPTLPRITLFIVGAGHVGQAVARLASEADFDVWVLDDRETFASKERFPTAQRLLIAPIGPRLMELSREAIHPGMYALIVTRGHAHDEEALYHLATTNAGYVGMIGSKRKIKLIFEDLLAKGIPLEALERVHAPLGLDIGSQTVPEIAVSIVAELIACRNLGTTRIPDRVRVRLGSRPS